MTGALLAAATDLTFSVRGYAAVLGNDVLTSLYLIMVKNTPSTSGLTTAGARVRVPAANPAPCRGPRPRAA